MINNDEFKPLAKHPLAVDPVAFDTHFSTAPTLPFMTLRTWLIRVEHKRPITKETKSKIAMAHIYTNYRNLLFAALSRSFARLSFSFLWEASRGTTATKGNEKFHPPLAISRTLSAASSLCAPFHPCVLPSVGLVCEKITFAHSTRMK